VLHNLCSPGFPFQFLARKGKEGGKRKKREGKKKKERRQAISWKEFCFFFFLLGYIDSPLPKKGNKGGRGRGEKRGDKGLESGKGRLEASGTREHAR